jgi:biopolymer transport protein ExbB/TolQ
MKGFISTASLVVLSLLVMAAGCDSKDTHQKAANDVVAAMSELNDALDGVKDEGSAKSAASKIEAVAAKIEKIAERVKALPAMSAPEKEALEKEMKARMDKEEKRMEANMTRIMSNPAALQALAGPLDKFIAAVAKATPVEMKNPGLPK